MPSMTLEIRKDSPLHQKLVKMLASRIRLAQQGQQTKHRAWTKAENTMLAYVPESDIDAARRSARENTGAQTYTTIQLPYTYALVMSMHTYITSVFFARSPVHQFAGRHGEGEQQVQALEALIGYQVDVGQMLGPYYIWIQDACKYGLGVIEEFWDDTESQFSSVQDMPDPNDPTGQTMVKGRILMRYSGYQGTRINNISPWDALPDPRVSVGNYQKGEFFFVRKRLPWNVVVKRKAAGYYMNVDQLTGEVRDFVQTDEGSQLERPDTTSLMIDDGEVAHPAVVPVYEGCVDLIPKEWGLGNSDFPEKWMFTITGDLSTLIGCQPHGAMHCEFPYAVIETEIEGYGSYGRGLPEIAEGIQNTLDWLINQHFFNIRAALNNQFILDPSKVVADDAEDGGPGFVWRLRPEAYGQDIRSFVYQIPVADVTRGHVSDISTMIGIGERTFGINDQIMGALSTGGRKTATEVRTSTGFGVNRQKTITEYISATGFGTHSQRMVQLSQQYFTADRKFRIAGSLLTDMSPGEQQQFIDVNPQVISGFYNFIPVDGTLPVDRIALANLWKDLLLQMRTVPGLIQQYDLGRIFGHVAQLAGIRNLSQFKIQIGSPAALAQAAEAGNSIPLPAPGRGSQNPAGVPTAGPAMLA
jgi:hypothetical protein